MKKVIIISGGSDGLGKEIVKKLSLGHFVVNLSLHKEKIEAVIKEFGCEGMVCDVSDVKAVEEAVARILKKHKRIDCLINNAGLWTEGPLETNDPAEIRRLLDVNTLGTILLSRAVVPVMKTQKSGLIINIISQAGLYGKAERSVYNASKWAITGFTKSLAPELAPFNIAVTGFYPGMMKTGIFAKGGSQKEFIKALEPEAVARAVAFVAETDAPAMFPEIGIKHVAQ